MKFRIGFPQSLQHSVALFRRGFVDCDRLKPPFQGTVLSNGCSEFLWCGGTDQPDLSPCQLRFQHVCCINCPFCGTGSHNGVQLINKQNDIAVLRSLCQTVLEPFFKVAPILCTGQQCRQIQCKQLHLL